MYYIVRSRIKFSTTVYTMAGDNNKRLNIYLTSPSMVHEFSTLVVIGTDYITKCKRNCHVIVVTTTQYVSEILI
jgi:hypothetical protein